jgi:single-strand selective monofunctional uracil DNA glycosylase
MSAIIDVALAAYRHLAERVDRLTFAPPVAFVYNPLRYAWSAHELYLRRALAGPPQVVLLGMNPGPWGMAQTGVPFGEVELVRSWLGIEAEIGRPPRQHPARPVLGFSCRRREVSGQRLWGWVRERWGEPERFFAHFAVLNYCPLMFLQASGGNLTPDRLPVGQRRALEAVCDAALRAVVAQVQPRLVVGLGGFARRRAAAALEGMGVAVGEVLHPSPANPRANAGWAQMVTAQLAALGVEVPKVSGAAACRGA